MIILLVLVAVAVLLIAGYKLFKIYIYKEQDKAYREMYEQHYADEYNPQIDIGI